MYLSIYLSNYLSLSLYTYIYIYIDRCLSAACTCRGPPQGPGTPRGRSWSPPRPPALDNNYSN